MHPPETSVDVIIPVLNEAHVLEKSVATVRRHLSQHFPYRWRIVVVDNGSTDGTQQIAHRLSETYGDVAFVHLTQRGRGRALRHSWLQSKADIVCYMDVDLSTDLVHLKQIVDAIVVDGYDVATGSRLMRNSVTRRCFRRELTSRIYNLLVKMVLFTKFSDAQCGFKAVSRETVERIVPQIEDQSWFFDTELLVLAEKHGYRIKDIPVVWIEDDDSRVKIMKTAWDDIKGILRLRKQLWKAAFEGASIVAVKRSLNR
jgi:glycosyltransferase involved in cell wall biosynthesis